MAIKNIFGRGIGFGAVHWVVTHGYASGAAIVVIDPPIPHRLSHDIIPTLLDLSANVETQLTFPVDATTLGFLSDDGYAMATPFLMTAGETGPVTLTCTGADGTAEDLSTASAVTLRVVCVDGTVVVNAIALSSPTSLGTAVWTRLTAQVATAGDYRGQVKVTRADASIGYYPDAQTGMPITMLPAV